MPRPSLTQHLGLRRPQRHQGDSLGNNEAIRMPTSTNWQLNGVTSEMPHLLAIVHANRGGIPANRHHTASTWPNIFTISRGNSDTKKHDILLNLEPGRGRNRSKSAVQPSCTGCDRGAPKKHSSPARGILQTPITWHPTC